MAKEKERKVTEKDFPKMMYVLMDVSGRNPWFDAEPTVEKIANSADENNLIGVYVLVEVKQIFKNAYLEDLEEDHG